MRSESYPHHGELAAALLSLPERNQEIIFLYFFGHYTQREIGEMYGHCRSTTGHQIRRTLQLLYKKMEVLSYGESEPFALWNDCPVDQWRIGRLVSNHSLSALLFFPKRNEHDFYLKLNSMPTFRKKYSKTFRKVLANICFLQYNKILSQENHNQLHIFTEFWSTA